MNSLYLNKINVVNYKNILVGEYELDRKINCFVGNNGVGKTNILDSIYHLSAGKSYFNSISSQTINHDQDFMFIDGNFIKNDKQENIICSLKKGKKKTLKRNGKIYKKLSEHVGLIPLVMISPSDRDLIQEGSSLRRKFIDSIISQNNKIYLNNIINYHKVLNQRNALLKYFNKTNSFDKDKFLTIGRNKRFVTQLDDLSTLSMKENKIDALTEKFLKYKFDQSLEKSFLKTFRLFSLNIIIL